MITLSEFLGTIPCAGNAAESVQIAIREAKRLEALDVPRVEAERKPLVDEDGDPIFVILDHDGVCVDWELGWRKAEKTAKECVEQTGYSHHVCQVIAPESGECPTIPVATFTHTPERPHEWVIYRVKCEYDCHWFAITARGDKYWKSSPTNQECQRFATAAEAQDYIDANGIQDAYPWPVPKLTN